MIELNNNQKIIVAVILTIIILVIGYYILDITQNNDIEIIENTEQANEKTENIVENISEIIVHIAGAVENEGIRKLPENSRIADAIEGAGGLTSDANINKINLAQKIYDGQKIYIPYNSEDENILEQQVIIEQNEVNIQTTDNLVNLNTATQTELEMLPGIGTSTASKILEYRKENGYFTKKEDIQNVSGIGESKYQTIKDKITI